MGVYSSCGELPFNGATVKIIGGDLAPPGKYRNVVAFKRDELTVCSGTLIAPDLVLTAAHCFERWQHSPRAQLSIFSVISKNGDLPSDLDRKSTVVDLEIHPRFWNDPRGAMDFAWVRIDPPFSDILPAEVPLSHLEMDDLFDSHETTIIAGYGLTTLRLPGEGEAPPIGVLHQAKSPINYRTGLEMFAGNHDVDSCSGDSGGPAFIAQKSTENRPARLLLAGVTSRGPMPCASDYESGAYGLVSEAVCWLRSSAKFQVAHAALQDFCLRETAMGAIQNDPPEHSVVLTKPFSEACQSESLSEVERHDLGELFRFAKIDFARTSEACLQLEQVLQGVTIMDLSNRHFRQLSWLRFATKLEWLDASDNLLESSEPLSLLTNLKMVDVRNNRIEKLTALTQMAETVNVFGLHSQASNISNTKYREIAARGSAAPQDLRSLTIVLRDMLAAGTIERKSLDLALKRQLDISSRGIRSIQALRGLENLEVLSLTNNPDNHDWDELLTLPRLRVLRYSTNDHIPAPLLTELSRRNVSFIINDLP